MSFSSYDDKKFRFEYYIKRIAVLDNGNIQFHDQEQSKFNCIVITNNGAHTLIDDEITKKVFQ